MSQQFPSSCQIVTYLHVIQPLFTFGLLARTLFGPTALEGEGELLGVPEEDDMDVLERAMTMKLVKPDSRTSVCKDDGSKTV